MSTSGRKNNLLVALLIVLISAGIYLVNTTDDYIEEVPEAIEFDDQAILERAYEDVRSSVEFPASQESQIIKVFDEDNQLIKAMTVVSGDDIVDEDFRKLVNQSTLLTEYSGNKLYRLKK